MKKHTNLVLSMEEKNQEFKPMKDQMKKKELGKKIHKLLNKTVERKLTIKEYCTLCLLIADVFDLTK